MLNAMHYTQHGLVSDVVEKITTGRREGEGVVVEKIKEVDKLSKKLCDLLTAITHTEILVALYKTNRPRKQNYESKTVDVSMM